MIERTLLIIKPEVVQRNVMGEILQSVEAAGLKIVAAKLLFLTKEEAQGFYAVHRKRPFFTSLTDFMSSGPIFVSVLEGENAISKYREIMGPTDSTTAPKGTIRGDFGTDVEKNAVHGSDGLDTAHWEIAYFFSEMEIHSH
jgi:nucleoside-diphosphate kinase